MMRFTSEDIKVIILQTISGVVSAIVAAWLLRLVFVDSWWILLASIIFAIAVICVVSFFTHNFLFYKRIIDVLQESDVSMHETIAYFCRRRRAKKWRNAFHINAMSITYKIHSYDFEKNRADVTITYNANAVNDTGKEFNSIYQCLLQNERYDITNKFSLNDEPYRPMEQINDLFIHRASLTRLIKKKEAFRYKISNHQIHGFSFDGSCSFIIDPLNYSMNVQEVTISIECHEMELWDWIKRNYRIYLRTSETTTGRLVQDSGIELIPTNGISNRSLENLLLSNLYFRKNPGSKTPPPKPAKTATVKNDESAAVHYRL